MASTNKTAHLGLCQWVETDPFLMDDMNDTLKTIDKELAPRLKLELLRDWELNARDVSQLELDVSDIDFGSYWTFVLIFRQTQSCTLRFNTSDITTAFDKEKFIFLPLKEADTFANYIAVDQSSILSGYRGINYSDITTINLLKINNMSFLNPTKIRLWGVK